MTPSQWVSVKKLQAKAKASTKGSFSANPSKQFIAGLDADLQKAISTAEQGGPVFMAMDVLQRRASFMQDQTYQIAKTIGDSGELEMDVIIHADHDNFDAATYFARLSAIGDQDGEEEDDSSESS